jgi:hypothetical protein
MAQAANRDNGSEAHGRKLQQRAKNPHFWKSAETKSKATDF